MAVRLEPSNVPLDLAALLLEAGAATAGQLERALARQREAGGALDTALLEDGAVREDELVRFLCRASGLPPPPPEPIEPDPRARRLFPGRVAERHGLAPFRLDGRELFLLAKHPVDLAALDEISFMLSLHLVPCVAPEWRVHELQARVYGTKLAERFAAVAEAVRSTTSTSISAPSVSSPSPWKGEGRGEGRPATGPAPLSGPPPASGEGETQTDDAQLGAIAIDVEDAPEPGPVEPRPPPALGFGHPGHEEPLAAALAQAVEAADAALLGEAGAREPPPEAPPRWSREEAFAALEAAHHRDEIVAVGLRYARDFFEAAAVFAVTHERVVGHDAVGWEGARERCRAVQLAPDGAGLFRAVIETSGPYLGPVAREPGNEALLGGLGRGWPRIALVYPVALRDRTVCVLYADNGDAPVSPRRLGDLLLLAGGLGGAFERILREAKRARAEAPPLGADMNAEQGAAFPSVPPDEGWTLREPALATEPAPPRAAPGGAAEAFEVATAAEALSSPSAFEPVDAVRRLCATAHGSSARGRLVARLVQHGPAAAAALAAVFPGPLDGRPAEAEAAPVEERGPSTACGWRARW